MNMRRLLFIVSLLLSPAKLAIGQGEYLNRGQSGIGASIDYASNDLVRAYGGTLGFTYKGTLDLDLGFTTIDYGDGNTISRSISPSVTLYLAKQRADNRRPTIGLFASYSNNSTRHWVFKTGPDDGFSFGVMVAHQVLRSDKILFQPTIGFSYIKAQSIAISGNFSIPIGIRLADGDILALVPSVSFQSPNTSYGGSFVLVKSLF